METILEMIQEIKNMNKNKFNQFLNYIITYINKESGLEKKTASEIILFLHQLKKDTPDINQKIFYVENDILSYDEPCTLSVHWVPGCFLVYLAEVFIINTFILLFAILTIWWALHPTTAPLCGCPHYTECTYSELYRNKS